MQHVIELRHDGRRHRGLMNGKVDLGLEQIAHPFTFHYAEQLEDALGEAWCLVTGDYVQLLVDGELLTDGYVTKARIRRTVRTYDFDATVKAPTIDLAQCSITTRPRTFRHAKIESIAAAIVAPFRFTVRVTHDTGAPLESFTADRNESPLDAIVRACRMRGFFPLYDPSNAQSLTLAHIPTTPTRSTLALGRNVIEMVRETDDEERFSEYQFRGKSRRTSDVYSRASQHGGVAYDPHVRRFRPTRVQARGAKGDDDIGVMARRERNQRAGASEIVSALVSGWRNDEGNLWRPGMLVPVEAPELALSNVSMLVTHVTYEFDKDMKRGFVADLELKRPEALDPDATYPAPFARGIGVPA